MAGTLDDLEVLSLDAVAVHGFHQQLWECLVIFFHEPLVDLVPFFVEPVVVPASINSIPHAFSIATHHPSTSPGHFM